MVVRLTPRKLTRSQLRTYALRILKEQEGLCALCGTAIDPGVKGELVVDHDHTTGLIRGVLHRSCNAAEGKVANAAGRWGAKSMEYHAIIPFLERLVGYLKQAPHPYVYPTHKTEEEQRLARNAKARRERATKKARTLVRGQRKQDA